MSYPRKLHILIVEDEQDPIDAYRDLLTAYRNDFPSVQPTIARSYADAEALLRGSRIFHCVILDLNLPLANREQPPEGLAPGQQLLELAANRDHYPIPVLLVVSGKLSLASLTDLHDRLARSFWHGAMINKGHLNMPDEIRNVSGRPNPASDGRLKTSHFEERQIESLLSWMRSASMEVGDGESAQSGHGRDDSVPSPAWLVRSSDCT